MLRYLFEPRLIFNTKKENTYAVKSFAMMQKKNLKIKQNDKKIVVVRCDPGCPFRLTASKSNQKTSWQVVTFKNEHTYHRIARNIQAKIEWLSNKFVGLLKLTLDMKTKALIAYVRDTWGSKMSLDQTYKAMCKAIKKLQCASKNQYIHLRNYGDELLRKSKNNIVVIKSDLIDMGPVFERIYICLEACKATFVTTCRPLIGLNGCFLKEDFGGHLLTAIGKDANNQMTHVAYAVVEAKTIYSWPWFIHFLPSNHHIERNTLIRAKSLESTSRIWWRTNFQSFLS